jgi:hypothetical protein
MAVLRTEEKAKGDLSGAALGDRYVAGGDLNVVRGGVYGRKSTSAWLSVADMIECCSESCIDRFLNGLSRSIPGISSSCS